MSNGKSTHNVYILLLVVGNNDRSKSCFSYSRMKTSRGYGTAHNSLVDYYNSKVLLGFMHFPSFIETCISILFVTVITV